MCRALAGMERRAMGKWNNWVTSVLDMPRRKFVSRRFRCALPTKGTESAQHRIESLEQRLLLWESLGSTTFEWSLPPLYGRDDNGDGRIDYHRAPTRLAANSGETPVAFDATSVLQSLGQVREYRWYVSGGPYSQTLTATTTTPEYRR